MKKIVEAMLIRVMREKFDYTVYKIKVSLDGDSAVFEYKAVRGDNSFVEGQGFVCATGNIYVDGSYIY